MLTRGRLLLALGVVVLAALVYTAWQAYETEKALSRAQSDVDALSSAVDGDDAGARATAIAHLRDDARAAHDHSGGWWFGALAHVPLIGGDVKGVRALSSSLDLVATSGVTPLATSLDELDRVSSGGGVDLGVVTSLQQPVSTSAAAFTRAAHEVDGLDSSGYVGPLRSKFDEYVDKVDAAASALRSAEVATRVLPSMAGADGPRNYLLVFQNNAEIRASGGVPGSWALVHADHGHLTLTRQGSDGDFPQARRPVVPLTAAERQVYSGTTIAQYFQDPGFTPDFPRAAQIFNGFWTEKFPHTRLDGVLSLDPVALSYLLDGTRPVSVDGVSLTPDNLVDELLSRSYQRLDPQAQDVFFQHVAQTIFTSVTGHVASPLQLVRGLARAGREHRFLVAPFDRPEQAELAGQPVLGAMSADDGTTPHVDVGLNDATGSKMSYYLRYTGTVRSRSCTGGVPSLTTTLTLHQTISPADAAKLSRYVNGGGAYGTPAGDELLAVRLYGPYGGSIGAVTVDGKPVTVSSRGVIDGRPVATVAVELTSTADVVLQAAMTGGHGQTGTGRLGLTPGIEPGSDDSTFANAC